MNSSEYGLLWWDNGGILNNFHSQNTQPSYGKYGSSDVGIFSYYCLVISNICNSLSTNCNLLLSQNYPLLTNVDQTLWWDLGGTGLNQDRSRRFQSDSESVSKNFNQITSPILGGINARQHSEVVGVQFQVGFEDSILV